MLGARCTERETLSNAISPDLYKIQMNQLDDLVNVSPRGGLLKPSLSAKERLWPQVTVQSMVWNPLTVWESLNVKPVKLAGE